MSTLPATRVNYFDRQHIRLAELQDEQAYHLQMRRRHNLSHHSWGIVTGLDLLVRDDGQVAVTPGLAIDGYGRELLSLDYIVITRADFDRRGASRLDVWVQYQVDRSSDRLAPVECGPRDSGRTYRATELAQVIYTRGGALPDPAHPDGVPIEAFDPPQLETPDDPARRWPVYLGRVVKPPAASASAAFEVETSDRVYVGLAGEIIDHPGHLARIELGRRRAADDRRQIGPDEVLYSGNAAREFGLFVPQSGADPRKPIEPTISVESTGTQIIGTTSVHGNLVLDGTSMQFPAAIPERADPATGGHPAVYRIIDSGNDELRLDLGSLVGGARALVIGVTKDGQFQSSIEISFPTSAASPLVRILGELRIEGAIDCQDVRVRTITAEAAAQITAMLQAALTA